MNEINTLENVVAIFDKCLDLLRDDSFITGEKALKIITQFIILKLMEPHFGNFIDIDNYDYDLSEIPLLQRESYKEKMLKASSNVLLVKDDVGMPKPSTRDLP